MRYIFTTVLSLLLIFLGISPLASCASETYDYASEITEELDGIFSDYDTGIELSDMDDLSIENIWRDVWNGFISRISAPAKLLSSVFLVIVFAAVMKSATDTKDEIFNIVCVIASVIVILPQLTEVYGELLGAVQKMGGFISVYVPVLSGISVACGGFSTAGVCHMLLLAASEVIVRLSESYLLPILGITASMGAAGSIFPNTSLESIVNLLKKTVTWAISVTMTLFSGFVALKCTITGRADGAAVKTAKMLVSGFVPIVGGAVSDAYSTVKGSFEVIGGTVGVAGIIAIAVVIIPTLLELLVYRFVMWAGSAAADVFGSDSISKLLKCIDSGFAIAQCVLICYSVIFILCTAILMKTFGG
ncbi:MAG: hypothetical protein IKV85_07570 [Ruminococcus sp.]|nr:hypothetical protein [Ruminococcus sp.]